MGVRRSNLDIYFRRVSPEELMNSLSTLNVAREKYITHRFMPKELYLRYAEPLFPHNSEPEMVAFYDFANESMASDLNGGQKSCFNLLYHYANDILRFDGLYPICRYDKILNWRDISNKLGQDLVTCAFLAYRSVKQRDVVTNFSWEPVIKTDNARLHKILQSGLAENHFHLFGSSRSFDLSWILLMNHPKLINQFSNKIQRPLNWDVLLRSSIVERNLWDRRLKYAARIRAFLFQCIMGIESEIIDMIDELEYDFSDKMSSIIGSLRYQFGHRTSPNGDVLDYALLNTLNEINYNNNRTLVGERYFLYQSLRCVYDHSFTDLQTNLFYLYLIIKIQLRGELIQSNSATGFKNFQNYQDRKNLVISRHKLYKKEIINLAINSSLKSHPIESFEVRVIPADTFSGNKRLIYDINEAYLAFSNLHPVKDNYLWTNVEINSPQEFPFFYVMHMPKRPDTPIPRYMRFIGQCRNHKIRTQNAKRSKALIDTLMKDAHLRKMIKGIDGCSDEIGCRPEVMATEIRTLRNFSHLTSYTHPFVNQEPLSIKFTYHVGEDYMDLLDGIRAVDEAICFLGLSRGDRLGHALSLGVSSEDYYESKGYKIVIDKQDLLDNIAWLLCRTAFLNVQINPRLKDLLTQSFNELIGDIYADYPYDVRQLPIYYDSWKLRGDSPSLYRMGNFSYPRDYNSLNEFSTNPLVADSIRNSPAALLYYAYHFDVEVRERGSEKKQYNIDNDLISLISQVQSAMRFFVANKGIGIETNPTSNYLISSFKRFDKHPILKFYNYFLEVDETKIHGCPQISVSINTDDQGVFDTCLENEYAVMASALERMLDQNKNYKFSSAQVYNWIDNVRKMGLEQSFKN